MFLPRRYRKLVAAFPWLMIEQQGRVVSTQDGRAVVRLGGTSGCSACDAGKGCGAGIFGRLLKRRPSELEIENTLGAEAGQAIVVGLHERLFLRLVLKYYLWPLFAALFGAISGHTLASASGWSAGAIDLAALLLAIAALVGTMYWNRRNGIEFSADRDVHMQHINLSERFVCE